jgi:hypothetical protein
MDNGAPPASDRADGAVQAARQWLTDVIERQDIRAAWRGTDPDYRLALTQAVIFLNDESPLLATHDRDELAHDLSGEDPQHELWPSFASLLVEEFLVDLGEINVENWRAAPRPISPGYELVLFAHAGGEDVFQPAEMQSHGVLMHLRGDRWLVAGLSERPATPGWPPDLGY